MSGRKDPLILSPEPVEGSKESKDPLILSLSKDPLILSLSKDPLILSLSKESKDPDRAGALA